MSSFRCQPQPIWVSLFFCCLAIESCALYERDSGSPVVPSSAVFVKVPKTGSTTLRGLLELMANVGNFSYFDNDRMSSCAQMKNAIEIARGQQVDPQLRDPVFASSHMPHCDFPSSFLLTMARDPVSRYVSHFYYTMYGPRPRRKRENSISIAKNYTHLIDREPSVNEFTASIKREFGERCLQKNDAPFNFLNNQHVYYFCGFPKEHEDCTDVCSEQALQRAIFNMKNGFDFVGVVENFSASLALLLTKIPQEWYSSFGADPALAAEQILHHPQGGHRNVNGKKHEMEPPSEETKRLLRVFNSNDMKLYETITTFFGSELKKYGLEGTQDP